MDTLIHADIFFFISAIWMIAISAVFFIILWNVARILNDARHISRKIREGSEVLSEDLREWRATIRTEGIQVMALWKFFKNLFSHSKSKTRKK